MKKKNGFIAISIIYSFFLCFVMLMAGLLANYASAKIILNKANEPLTYEVKDEQPEPPVVPDEPDKILLRDKIMDDNSRNWKNFQNYDKNTGKAQHISSGDPDFSKQTPSKFYSQESGMFLSENDYNGYTYFFRGAVENNYVKFADILWRITRINGDKSIRLILDKGLDLSWPEYNGDNFFGVDKDPKMVGYTYDNAHNCTTANPCESYYDNTKHKFEDTSGGKSSNIKKVLEKWFEDVFVKNELNKFITKTYFCNNVQQTDSFNITRIEARGATQIYHYYNITLFNDFYKLLNEDVLKEKKGILISNYTYDAAGAVAFLLNTNSSPGRHIKNSVTNICSDSSENYGGVYRLQIGLPTVNDLVMAGITTDDKEDDMRNYLYPSAMTMSPAYANTYTSSYYGDTIHKIVPSIFIYDNSKTGYNHLRIEGTSSITVQVRPVINLDEYVVWKDGDGTKDRPYEIVME